MGVSFTGYEPDMVKMKEVQQKRFGDLSSYVSNDENLHLDENGALRRAKHEGLPVLVPYSMIATVLKLVHGSTLAGHYRKHRRVARIKEKFWQKNRISDLSHFLSACVPCTVPWDQKPGLQGRMEHLKS